MRISLEMLHGMRKSGSLPGEYQCICPSCGERTFYVNLISRKFICFRETCGIKGSLNDEGCSEITYSPSLLELKKAVHGLFSRSRLEPEPLNLDLFSDPITKNSMKDIPFAMEYLKRRKFSIEDIFRYRLRIGKKYYDRENEKVVKVWQNRIIFPFYDTDTPLYAIGRSYNGMNPKYLNTKGEKSVVVYNIDKIKNRTCIICEGLISSIFAEKYSGISAVCILGCYISEFQFYQIRSAVDKVYISLDGGVDVKSMCDRFMKSGCETYFVDLPKGVDPDECGPDYIKYIQNAKQVRII